MGKLTDVQIKAWIRAGERFDGRSDSDGLTLRFRACDRVPTWHLRYRFAGRQRTVQLGSYGELSLAKARELARTLSARVALGHDVAGEKQARKQAALDAVDAMTVLELANEYYTRQILGRWKHPDIFRRRIDKDIAPHLGKLRVEDVKPRHIDAMLQAIVARDAPTIANDVLRWTRRMFDFAIKRHIIEVNPASTFDLNDAGGKEVSRERSLSRDEVAHLFAAMKKAKGFSRENELAIKLLLTLGCRKMELCAARWEEFDLGEDPVWHLPAERTKTGAGIAIPLPPFAVECLLELRALAGISDWVLPARKMQHRMLPHIGESTLNVALAKVRHQMPDVEAFTVHDLRRTARTLLASLGVPHDVAEACLNHKLQGVAGIYDRHDRFAERKDALLRLSNLLESLELGEPTNVVGFARKTG
ncbi:site-specific integrase [Plesiomonas sp. ZOR0011]|uniref:tyrosine-type recombinase/integrase n=1 Tax=Plesiomonas sp. ZOR0011 TaxID=1339230 RepID=UPI00064914EC|nr:site-specific integrase [Plesiomonas sp. ZOR0011]